MLGAGIIFKMFEPRLVGLTDAEATDTEGQVDCRFL